MIKMIIFAICCVLLGILLKNINNSYGLLVGLACGLVLIGFGLGKIQEIMDRLNQLGSYMGKVGGYFPLLLKVLGITYICEFAAGVSRDVGYQTIGSQIELLGKVSVMLAGLPVIFAVIDQLHSLL